MSSTLQGFLSNPMSANMGDVSEQTQDFAVEAWHEDGRWSLAALPDPDDLTHIIDRLKKQQTNGAKCISERRSQNFGCAFRLFFEKDELLLAHLYNF
jgi:hypothetical protein